MKTRRKYLVGLLAATLVLTGMPVQHTQAAKAAKLSSKKVILKVGKSKTITLKNNKKKTTWKVISGKKCIKLKNKKKNKGAGCYVSNSLPLLDTTIARLQKNYKPFLKKLSKKGRNAVLLAQRTNLEEIHWQFDEARNGGVFQTRTL